MPIAARAYTMADILFEFEATCRREGRTSCPVTAWVKANPDKTQDEFEAWISTHPDYAAPTCADIIRCTGHFNTPEATAQLQRLYAGFLVAQPWQKARPWIEGLLSGQAGDVADGLDMAALKLLVACMAEHHPSPKGFFAQPHVIGRIPRQVDLSHLRSDAHPELAGLPLQGGA
ncbi:MAG TPA: hypothetical protein VGG29_03555 [Caulobacteraceae bacterium]|jgi:hypothetical protein